MTEDETKKDAINGAARALHETYFGRGTWGSYGSDARIHARRALHRALLALAAQGFELVPSHQPTPQQDNHAEARLIAS